MSVYKELALKISDILETKNKSYGNSFELSGDFLRLLWPNGCPPEQFDDMLAFARMFDKMKRIATDKSAFGEDPYQDLVGYTLLNLYRSKQKNVSKTKPIMTPEQIISKAKELEEKYAKLIKEQVVSNTQKEKKCPIDNSDCSCVMCVDNPENT